MKNSAVQSNRFITNSSKETKSLAKNFARQINKGDILVFFGGLGSGKTTFIQGLARGLGIKKRIISPTFIIVRHYKLNSEDSFYHIDLYRTSTKKDLLGLGLDQIIKDKNNIVAIEWGEKLQEFLPQKRIEIKIKNMGKRREILIDKYE